MIFSLDNPGFPCYPIAMRAPLRVLPLFVLLAGLAPARAAENTKVIPEIPESLASPSLSPAASAPQIPAANLQLDALATLPSVQVQVSGVHESATLTATAQAPAT